MLLLALYSILMAQVIKEEYEVLKKFNASIE